MSDGDLEFAVRDSGIGITPEQQAKLFERLLPRPTRPRRASTAGPVSGSPSRRKLGGDDGRRRSRSRAWPRPHPGTGRRSRSRSSAPRPSRLPVPRSVEAAFSQDRRILVVDDNQTNRKHGRAPARPGRCHRRSRSRPDALEAGSPLCPVRPRGQPIGRSTPVVLDYHMPGMDGVELARRLNRLDAALPLVMLSSLSERPDEADDLFAAWLAKPTKQTTLLRTLSAVPRGDRAGVGARPVRLGLRLGPCRSSSAACRGQHDQPEGGAPHPLQDGHRGGRGGRWRGGRGSRRGAGLRRRPDGRADAGSSTGWRRPPRFARPRRSPISRSSSR